MESWHLWESEPVEQWWANVFYNKGHLTGAENVYWPYFLNIQNENNVTDFHNKNVSTFIFHFIFGMIPWSIIMHNLHMGTLKLRYRSRLIISSSQFHISWALPTELQVVLDIGDAKVNKMCTHSSPTTPFLSLLFSRGLICSLSLSWAGSSPTQTASVQEELTSGYPASSMPMM